MVVEDSEGSTPAPSREASRLRDAPRWLQCRFLEAQTIPCPVDAGILHPTPFHPYPPLTISYGPQIYHPASILESTHSDPGCPMPIPRSSYMDAACTIGCLHPHSATLH